VKLTLQRNFAKKFSLEGFSLAKIQDYQVMSHSLPDATITQNYQNNVVPKRAGSDHRQQHVEKSAIKRLPVGAARGLTVG
jgi:hypothetical protein